MCEAGKVRLLGQHVINLTYRTTSARHTNIVVLFLLCAL